ncbi:MAG: hypothetical protein IT379_10495 [Deltaproteobacteria bacterium]|nr:hypothetical protein [Deltaproteobacteria bacterium]
MAGLLGTRLDELAAGLRRRQVPLPPEIAAFVALEVSEALLAGPAIVGPSEVVVGPDGSVSVFAPPASASTVDASKAVVSLLAMLLRQSRGTPAALSQMIERAQRGQAIELARLRAELEALLIPLNRGATRRVLARLLRDAAREDAPPVEVEPGDSTRPPPDAGHLAAGVDALLSGAMTPAPPPPAVSTHTSAPPPPEALETGVDDLLASAPAPRVPSTGLGPTGSDLPPVELWEAVARNAAPSPKPAQPAQPKSSRPPPPSSPPPREAAGAAPIAPTSSAGAKAAQPAPAAQVIPITDARSASVMTPTPTGATGPHGHHAAGAAGAAGPHIASLSAPSANPAIARALDAPLPTRKPLTPLSRIEVESGPEPDLTGLPDPDARASRPWGLLAFGLVLLLVLGGGVALYFVRPDLVHQWLGRPTDEQRLAAQRAADERAQRERERQEGLYGELTVESDPPEAQVLLFLGRAPAEMQHLPPGVAHEVVAVADGYAPGRAVIAPDAPWERLASPPAGTDPFRVEIGLQLPRLAGDAGVEPEIGPTQLPQAMGQPRGSDVGTLRVVTTPPGAKVYYVAGFTPTTIRDMRTDRAVELLVYRPGHRSVRHVVAGSDWSASQQGVRTATARVRLEPLVPDAGPPARR